MGLNLRALAAVASDYRYNVQTGGPRAPNSEVRASGFCLLVSNFLSSGTRPKFFLAESQFFNHSQKSINHTIRGNSPKERARKLPAPNCHCSLRRLVAWCNKVRLLVCRCPFRNLHTHPRFLLSAISRTRQWRCKTELVIGLGVAES